MISYGFTKEINYSFDETIEKVTNELKKEGFGILTRIDVDEKFKEKLGIDFNKYIILGACHPKSAHQAIVAEENIGLMLPCNVIVYEKEKSIVVSIIKPTVAMSMIQNDSLETLANHIESKLQHVIEAL